jgi:hypothetical protein
VSRSTVRCVLCIVTLSLLVVALHRIGRGALAAPPFSVDGVAAWLEGRDTATIAAAILRLGAMAMAAYLLVVCLLDLVAIASGSAGMARRVGRVAPRWAQPLLGTVTLFGLMAAPPPAPDPPAPQSPDTLIERPAAPESETATMTLLPAVTVDPPPVIAPAPAPTPPLAPAFTSETAWTVAPGDSFWSIATEVVADTASGPVDDGDVVPVWQQLIDLNRDRLVDPQNADLLLPGQELALPAVAPGA